MFFKTFSLVAICCTFAFAQTSEAGGIHYYASPMPFGVTLHTPAVAAPIYPAPVVYTANYAPVVIPQPVYVAPVAYQYVAPAPTVVYYRPRPVVAVAPVYVAPTYVRPVRRVRYRSKSYRGLFGGRHRVERIHVR